MKRHPLSVAALVAFAFALKAALLLPAVAMLAPAANYFAPAFTAIAWTVVGIIIAFGILRFAQVISLTNVLAKVRVLAFRDDLKASAAG